MWRCGALMLLVAIGGGCANGMNYLIDQYGTMPPQIVSTKVDQWWIFDKPNEGKILVQRNPGSAAAQGFTGGLFGNPAAAAAPKPYYQEAAEAFFAQGDRRCRIKDGYLVMEPSWEFTYECDPAPIVTGSLPKGASK